MRTSAHNHHTPNGEKETSRLEAFSDGVFAIAITLLIIDLKVPHVQGAGGTAELFKALAALWPSFVAFLASFVAVLILWVNHHGLFRLIHTLDAPFMYLNGYLLLMVTFVPYPTAVLAQYLTQASGKAAAAFYCGTFVLINIGFNLMWVAIRKNPRLLKHGIPPEHLAALRRAARLALPVYLGALLLSFVNAYAGLALCSAPWVAWAKISYNPEDRSVTEHATRTAS